MGIAKVDWFAWTDERVGLLRQMWTVGASGNEIAMALGGGCSRNAVIGKAHRLGLSGRPPRFRATVVRLKPLMSGQVGAAVAKKLSARTPKAKRADEGRRVASSVKHRAKPLPEGDEAIELPQDQSPDAVTFISRAFGQCRWPLNDVVPIAQHMVCGTATGSTIECEKSYCARHNRVATAQVRLRNLSDDERARRQASARKNYARHQSELVAH